MAEVRQGKPLWFGILVVVVFFVSVTLAFAYLGSDGPAIPHAVDREWASCVACHPTAALPAGHAGRADDSCRTCHAR